MDTPHIYFTPKDRKKYSAQICEFNKGSVFSVGLLKKLRNVQLTEICCAARSDVPSCHYILSWTPDPPIIDRLKSFILFRFQSQKAILAHMEETYNSLQQQYSEAKRLNDELSITLSDKSRLSESLAELNRTLEEKVALQTKDIREKNVELEATNKQLRESERMKELLTGTLVHDIKNHIFSMASDVRALIRNDGCSTEAQGILSHTASACSSAMSLASNMLEIGKMEEGRLVVEPSEVDFRKVESILDKYVKNVFFSEKSIKVTVTPPGFDLKFAADHYLLDRVLQNLLTNAAMYTPEHGQVAITFAAPATIRIFNSGDPIPAEYRVNLFEKYARIRTDSSRYSKGLGLFFCRLAMTAHKGGITLECTDEGNCFVVKFEV